MSNPICPSPTPSLTHLSSEVGKSLPCQPPLIAHAISQYDQQLFEATPEQPLQLTATMKTPHLTPDSYWLTITLFNGKRIIDQLTQVVRFTVLEATYLGQASFNSQASGHLLLPVAWETR